MAARNHNDGFDVLDDFVAIAIPGPVLPLGTPVRRGLNEGFVVLEEVVFDAGARPQQVAAVELAAPAPEEAIKSMVGPLVAYIAASKDPAGTLDLCQKLLLAEFAGSRHDGHNLTAG